MSIYFIYKTTNIINGRIYIGSHKSDTIIFDNYFGSGKALKFAIEKYGKDNFKREILEIVIETNKKLSNKEWVDIIFPVENKWIKYYTSLNINLYNINKDAAWGGSTTHNRMWIHNPLTLENKMVDKNSNIPKNFIKGRIVGDWNIKQTGSKLYTNLETNIEKRFKTNPGHPWKIGSLKQLKRKSTNDRFWIVNHELQLYSYPLIGTEIPENFIEGHPGNKNFKFYKKIKIN